MDNAESPALVVEMLPEGLHEGGTRYGPHGLVALMEVGENKVTVRRRWEEREWTAIHWREARLLEARFSPAVALSARLKAELRRRLVVLWWREGWCLRRHYETVRDVNQRAWGRSLVVSGGLKIGDSLGERRAVR